MFQKWNESVKPTISVNWEKVNKKGIISADFFLADLLSSDNRSLKENLFVVLEKTHYKYAKEINEDDEFIERIAQFKDEQKMHRAFWAIYERPPKEIYWKYIIERRDLLVPQDIRERKGSFFTPEKWVIKSREYLVAVLGEDWQDKYYIWDCCAGTGNLVDNLANYDNVWASTIDKADVDVMRDRIENGWNMAEDHVFQFDFLNDDFLPQSKGGKVPDDLAEILADEEKRKWLVMYINPPYAEAGTKKTVVSRGKNKSNVSNNSLVWKKHKDSLGLGIRELYVQFLTRIYDDISGCKIGQFSKLKIFEGTAFAQFRDFFLARLEKTFIAPASTFDNVSGKFPIGFFIWDTAVKEKFSKIQIDAYDAKGKFLLKKMLSVVDSKKITDWISNFDVKSENSVIGYTGNKGPDIQNTSFLYISSVQKVLPNGALNNDTKYSISKDNLIPICIYCAVRWSITHIWYNDRDQFLFPNDGWQDDREFQLDCLIFTLFHGQNRISAERGINHWIPFRREQFSGKRSIRSHFMSDFLRDFMAGGTATLSERKDSDTLFEQSGSNNAAIDKGACPLASGADNSAVRFSPEAQAVYDAGLALWRYYHAQNGAVADASFYDIRRYFQGTDGKGRMKNDSTDEQYKTLIADLREKQKALASRISEKVYEYGFLR